MRARITVIQPLSGWKATSLHPSYAKSSVNCPENPPARHAPARMAEMENASDSGMTENVQA